MTGLSIPFAFNKERKLINPKDAVKNEDYFCPSCYELVVLRQGKIKVAHFAHKATNICNQETIIHKTAKLLVQKVVKDWVETKSNSPVLERICQICYSSVNQNLPEKVEDAILEYRLSDGSIADIALIVNNTAKAAIEIKVTHAVDEIKANKIAVPFIELDGYEVIANPTNWKPITDKFKPITCKKCKQAFIQFQDRINRIAKINNIILPTAYYRYGFCNCWKCNREIIVFAWPNESSHDNIQPKITPIPKTIQYRFSKTVGDKYWANVCQYCQSIQGDFFLYSEPDGAFFALNCEEDSPSAFNLDILKIASHAAYNGIL
jgi:hypothetical protein